MKRFLVTGTNLINKGAQMLMYVTINELKRRFPECKVYVLTAYSGDEIKDYDIDFIHESEDAHIILFHPILGKIYAGCKDVCKWIIKRPKTLKRKCQLYEIYPKLTAVVDVSGFALSSKWGKDVSRKYLRRIEEAKKYNVPIYLMTQSFGPFTYNNSKFNNLISKTLNYPQVICVRETSGFRMLKDISHNDNIKLYPDIVLSHDEPADSFRKNKSEIPDISNRNVVGIVPNVRLVKDSTEKVIDYFVEITENILKLGMKAILVAHSDEDLPMCNEIYKKTSGTQVDIINWILDPFEFCALSKKFVILIGARYHSLVHALKNGVPCIAVGWADKYDELLGLFNMEKYVLNIESSSEEINTAINDLISHRNSLSEVIETKINDLKMGSCFDEIK